MTPADLLSPGPTRVMGIVNVTPDSFADDVHRSLTQAIEHGIDLAEQGADLIDVGGRSTRPGAQPVDPAAELARVVPVVAALAGAGIPVSIDTTEATVAAAALQAGALIVNDVSGGLVDPAILEVAAAGGAGYILQHWRTPFDHRPSHIDVVSEVRAELAERAGRALAAGIDQRRLILDPGIGFGKTAAQNWALLARADAIAGLGFPVLWGVSRKRFLAEAYDHPTEPWQRDEAGVALTALLAEQGVWAVRTHTAAAHRAAIAVVEARQAAMNSSVGKDYSRGEPLISPSSGAERSGRSRAVAGSPGFSPSSCAERSGVVGSIIAPAGLDATAGSPTLAAIRTPYGIQPGEPA